MRGTSAMMPNQKQYGDRRRVALSEWLRQASEQFYWLPLRNTVYPRGFPRAISIDPEDIFAVLHETLKNTQEQGRENDRSLHSAELSGKVAAEIQRLFPSLRQKTPRYNPGTHSGTCDNINGGY
eukprot:gb/GECG01011551.1/.p1 GENE.gb/GECG01011551.1/~~gb/GECG01011551.1/.p1  ORF type:complete len:124 (+),score=16.27 gb/GECG01011551.1/:1-372(+)